MFIGWSRTSCLLLAVACQNQIAPETAKDLGPDRPLDAAVAAGTKPAPSAAAKPAPSAALLFEDPLSGPSLSKLWTSRLTHLEPPEAPQRFEASALHLGLDTLKRKPGEISVNGLVHREALDWSEDPVTIRLGLDWLEQKNASYLSVGLLVVPEGLEPASDPRLAERNLALFFAGVPPGAQARRVVRLRKAKSTVWEDLEGWPERDKEGRSIGRVEVELTLSDDALRLRESGRPDVLVKRPIGFSSGRLMLFVASQSNAPLRWGGFRSLRVLRGLVD